MNEVKPPADPDSGWAADETEVDPETSMMDTLVLLAQNKALLILFPLLVGLLALGATYVIAPTFTSRTLFLPPQQQQTAAASAIASLGALGSLAGAAAGIRSPGEQYVALMSSTTVTDRIIDEFKLMEVYESDYRVEARKELAQNVRIALGKKDGLVSVEVDDKDPARAAAMANRYVEELRVLSEKLVLTEAQQRRVFFEGQLAKSRDRLAAAQKTLQESGFTQGALKAEPKAAAEGYARLRAEVTNAEVRLEALRRGLLDNTPEVQQALSAQTSLRAQLAKLEQSGDLRSDSDYVSKYREFKYQEVLFELFARQYELARVDESREGPLIQVVDVAQPPERKSKPKRAMVAVLATLLALAAALAFVFGRRWIGDVANDPEGAEQLARLKLALRGKA